MTAANVTIIVTSDFPPAHGGIQRYCASLANALALAGRSVCVVTSAPADDGGDFDRAQPYRIVRVRANRLTVVAKLHAALLRTLGEYRADDVIVANWKPAGVAAVAARLRRRFPLTIVAHGSEIAAQTNAPRRLALRTILARADRVVAVSSFTQRLVAEMSACEAEVIPCGVEAFEVARATATEPTILSVGRLVPRKGFDRLIEAFARYAPNAPAWLEIVGDGPQRSELEALARNLGVAGRIRFHGTVDEPALRDAYARAWCFAMPSRREGDEVEGFGIVYLEAAMAGLAAIGGRSSGAEDAIEDGATGLLVDGRSVDQIGAALEFLLRDRARAIAMGEAARRRALEHFSWARVARKFTSHHEYSASGAEPGDELRADHCS